MTMQGMLGDLGEYYPGSRERRQVNHVPGEDDDLPELGPGTVHIVQGIEVEFWGIRVLASVLNRQPVTIRGWENGGILPAPTFSKPGRHGDQRGRRRLWTRAQILGIWKIAREEGVLDPGPRVNIAKTQFTPRVTALFEQLRREGLK